MKRVLTTAMLILIATAWGCDPAADSLLPEDFVPIENGDENTGDPSGAVDDGALTISGRLTPAGAGKSRPNAQEAPLEFGQVVAVSSKSLEVYDVTPNDDGTFSFELPPEEQGSVFQLTLIGPDGRAAGPIVLGASGGSGFTGLSMNGAVEMGDIGVPGDPTTAPIMPANNENFAQQIATEVAAKVDNAGVPVGVPSVGKGQGALNGQPSDRNILDADQDGLIDLFDADDNGNGIVDDFDSGPTLGIGMRDGVQINLFMNLKLDDMTADAFYTSDDAGVQEILNTRTVITFEVRGDGSLKKNITGARILDWPAPAPAYLDKMTLAGPGGSSLWSASGYAFQPWATNHFQQWATPNWPIEAGDLFTFEVSFDDGSTARYTRMINFVFRSVPKLIAAGVEGGLSSYVGPGVLSFDGTQDLALEWEPPYDDLGAPLTGFTYFFEIFYNDGGGQQVQNVDGAATWPTPIPKFDTNRRVFEIDGTSLATLSADGTLAAVLPKEIFANTLQTSGGAVSVGSYKIDIAAQKNGNNAALMLPADK